MISRPLSIVAALGILAGLVPLGWILDESIPAKNPMAILGSGLGSGLSRWLTDVADSAYHHGSDEKDDDEKDGSEGGVQKKVADTLNHRPLSAPIDHLAKQLSVFTALQAMEGRVPQGAVRQALQRAEFWERAAFELDPGNYRAYEAYLLLLTTDINKTEFGALLTPQYSAAEKQARKKMAIDISEIALASYRLRGSDIEQYLGAASTWFNLLDLQAPYYLKDAKPQEMKEFLRLSERCLPKMREMLDSAKRVMEQNIASGQFAKLSDERQKDIQTGIYMLERLYDAAMKQYSRELARQAKA